MNGARTSKTLIVQGPWGEHTYLAWSLGRTVSLAGGFFRVGPRGGKEHRYAVRLGVDEMGIAKGGCCLTSDRDEAVAWFLKYCEEERRLYGSFGGTGIDPDSIDVDIAR